MNGTPHAYLIIGCGHFGTRAAEKLFQKDCHSRIIVVDKSRRALQKVSLLPVESSVCEGVSYLKQFLSQEPRADYILPAVPFHLAFEFILSRLKPFGAKEKTFLSFLDSPIPRKAKQVIFIRALLISSVLKTAQNLLIIAPSQGNIVQNPFIRY